MYLKFYIYFMYMSGFIKVLWEWCLLYMYTCAQCVCPVPTAARRVYPIPWNLSYRLLWAILCMVGIEPRSSRRAASALKLWVFSPVSMCMHVLPTCVYVHHVHIWCPCDVQKQVSGPPGTGVMNGCKLLCRFWEPNRCPLQEQQVILSAESPLQSPK